MAHFAELDDDNIVIRVICIKNDILLDANNIENEQKGCDFLAQTFGGRWIQTSYNNNFRGLFAGEGMKYDKEKDVFTH